MNDPPSEPLVPAGSLSYVYDGQLVYAKINKKEILCEVVCAAGDTARVVNELYKIDTWFHIRELREKQQDE